MSSLDLEGSYRALGEGAVAIAEERDGLVVAGPDAREWLQGQLSQDLAGLEVGGTAESLVLSPQGKIDVYCRVTVLAGEAVLLDTAAGWGEVLGQRLRRFHIRVKAGLTPVHLRCLCVRGPEARTQLEAAGIQVGRIAGADPEDLTGNWSLAAPLDWPRWSGVDLLTPASAPRPALPAGVELGTPEAFEAKRIEAGFPSMGRELTDRTIPQEAGALVEHAVSFTKGCYTGQELVARLDARGSNVARRLRGVVLEPGAHGEEGSALVVGEREVGQLTSVAWSPATGSDIALAYVHRDVVPPAPATVTPGGQSCKVWELPLQLG